MNFVSSFCKKLSDVARQNEIFSVQFERSFEHSMKNIVTNNNINILGTICTNSNTIVVITVHDINLCILFAPKDHTTKI